MNTSDNRCTRPFASRWVIAACLALSTIWLAQLYFRQKSEFLALREEAALARVEVQALQNQLQAGSILASQRLTDLQEQAATTGDLARLKIARLVPQPGNASQASAIVVWDPVRQEGVLAVEKLPAAASDQDYQLWIIDPQYPHPINAGSFGVDPQTGGARIVFHPVQPIATAAKFAVRCERKGGSPGPEGPFVLLSE